LTRSPRRRVDGVLLLDKPAGMTSNGALQQAKRLFRAEKAGHTGTLDPLATGLLPLCFGEATKFAQALLDAPKRYTATIRFGTTTTTGDAEGDVLVARPCDVDVVALHDALRTFTGILEQVPPRYAALKHEGRAYYDYARAGVEVPRVARTVEVRALRLLDWTPPDAVVDVECSKGTYVRTLAEDIGERLGCGAHLAALRRTATGPFLLADAWTFDALAALDEPGRDRALLPVDTPLADVPVLGLAAADAAALRQGRSVSIHGVADGLVRGYLDDAFVGLLEARAGTLHVARLMRTDVPPAPRALPDA
jgi:tRNA pseudouridine55 synthase